MITKYNNFIKINDSVDFNNWQRNVKRSNGKIWKSDENYLDK